MPETHQHRMMHTKGVEAGGDEVTGRKLLMWNADVEISLCRPTEQMDYFFRNGEGDEVIFVHEGSGHARDDLRRACPTRTATTSSSRAARPTGSCATKGSSAISSSRRPA